MTEYEEIRMLNRGRIVIGGRALCWHRWAVDEVEGVWHYRECGRCHRRIADLMYSNLMGPVDWHWLYSGDWSPLPVVPPPSPLPPPMVGR